MSQMWAGRGEELERVICCTGHFDFPNSWDGKHLIRFYQNISAGIAAIIGIIGCRQGRLNRKWEEGKI
jgi:hypothetical protein